MSYYFLGSVLPPLKLGMAPELHFEDLLVLLEENMSARDFKKIAKIRSFIDLQNVKYLLQKEPLDERGNMSEKELDQALVTREGLPEYLYEYLDDYEQTVDQIRHFSSVYVKFFREMEQKEKGFLSFYFNFEREWRLLMIGFRSKRIERDLSKELQYEDFQDPLVAHLLAQKDSPQFEFPFEYQDFDEQVKQAQDHPMDQYQALAKYRFNRLQNQVQDHPFSADYALGYFVQYMLVQDWNQLNNHQGNQKLNGIVKELG